MQYFNVNNTVHALDDGIDPADFIKQAFTRITKEEADIMLTPPPPPPPTAQEQRDAIQAQIDSLEQKELYPRLSREIDIQLMEEKAIALGAAQIPALDAATSLAFAYATNIGYKKLKDFDAQITALRTQMEAIV